MHFLVVMMSSKGDQIQIETENGPNYSVEFVDGVFGLLNPNVGQMIFWRDVPDLEVGEITAAGPQMRVKKVKRVILFDARMSPEVFKSIATWMMNHVKECEKMVGQGDKTESPQVYYQ
jgi:hypothetical protein